MSQASNSVFAAVGGAEGVSRIVEAFYRRVVADPVLRPVYPDDLEPGKERLKLFLVQWLGDTDHDAAIGVRAHLGAGRVCAGGRARQL